MADPVHKTLLVLDIEKFGPRQHIEQAEAQRVMYGFLEQVLAKAEIEQTSARVEDRGDGVFVVLDADVAKAKLIRSILTELPTALYDYNRLASDTAKIRMRAAVHAGDVEITSRGVLGTPAIEVFRLLNSKKLYAQLEESGELLVFAVSEAVHHDVILHDFSGIRADHFHPINADDKEPRVAGWVYATTPAESAAPAPRATPTPRPQAPAPQPPAPTSGNFFSGSGNITFHGDNIAGNKTVNHE
ncbi:serine/arginine repetitive matrix protein 2 [Nocardioidaceae bacterium Broad-1]|nr:serine/arginine repetitive matrix protein 2 [Nocardioidaceae bacterium Broad-1]